MIQSGTRNAYNNVKDLNGSFKTCRVHFFVKHAATQFIHKGEHSGSVVECLTRD